MLLEYQANLESMFLDINDKVGVIATDVGKTPMGWNGEVYNFIKNINDNVGCSNSRSYHNSSFMY